MPNKFNRPWAKALRMIPKAGTGFTGFFLEFRLGLTPALAKLLSPETSDPVQPETEDHTVLFSQTHVERRKLHGRRTTVPRVSQRHRRADQ